MIKSFNCKETQKIFERTFAKKLPQDIQAKARQKLVLIDAATELIDLRIPPGNRLKELKDDRKGQHSIRINGQWNGASALFGKMEMHMRLKLSTTINNRSK